MLRRTTENALWLSRYRVRATVLARALTMHFENLLDSPGKKSSGQLENIAAERWLPCFLLQEIDHAELFSAKTGELKSVAHSDIVSLLISDNRSSHSLTGLLQQVMVHLTCCQDFLHNDIVEHLFYNCQQFDHALTTGPDMHACIRTLPALDMALLTVDAMIEHRMPRTPVYHFIKSGEHLERANQAIRLIQMAEDEWFREAPLLKLVSTSGSSPDDPQSEKDGEHNRTRASDDNSTQIMTSQNATSRGGSSNRRTRSAISRHRVRDLAASIAGVGHLSTQTSNKFLPGPGSVDVDLFNRLIQNQQCSQSLAFNLQGMCAEMSSLDPHQQAVTIAKSLLRRVAFVDTPLQQTDRESVMDLLEEYQYALEDIHQALFDRYMRGSEVPQFDNSPPLRAGSNTR